MRHRTAVIVAALVLLVCARMPAWSAAASPEGAAPPAPLAAPGDGRVEVDVEWELASKLGRWLEITFGKGRELRTWL